MTEVRLGCVDVVLNEPRRRKERERFVTLAKLPDFRLQEIKSRSVRNTRRIYYWFVALLACFQYMPKAIGRQISSP